jgi:peptidoglycan glycosyltransferase
MRERNAEGKPRASTSKKKKEVKINREILRITYVFAGLFFILLGYFIYFQVTEADTVVNNSYNTRQKNFAKRVIRGNIESADGEVLAYTKVDADGNETRVYPFDNVFCHVVGIDSYGKYGLELSYNFDLLTSNINPIQQMLNELQDQKNQGDTLVTTLDSSLQKIAYNALGDYDGAVVILEPSTGKILAMVSKPDYNPNTISNIWDSINSEDSTESVLVNRATQGKYTPGSVFKIFTTVAWLRNGGDADSYQFNCTGNVTFDTEDAYSIHCYGYSAHGTETLEQAFAYSCNGAYATIGEELTGQEMADALNEMLFETDLKVPITASNSSLNLDGDADLFDRTQTAIGQGKTSVTPMHMAMIASAVANDGVLMEPYLVSEIRTSGGSLVKKYSSTKMKDLFSKDESSILSTYMHAVVDYGTAKVLNTTAYDAAGKTGTAELDNSGRINLVCWVCIQ